MELPRGLDTKQAGLVLGLSRKTLEKYRVYGGGPDFHKNGRRVVYYLPDLQEWIGKRRRRSTADVGPAEHATAATS